jgi:transposase InsO family protein
LGSFPRAVGGFRYLYVAIDKFTKLPEATPTVKINKQSTVKFIKAIIYRFNALNRIITDIGSQFTSSAFQGYSEDLGIQIYYPSVAHQESNGQVKRDSVEILKGLKTRTYDYLKKLGAKWIDDFRAHCGSTGHLQARPRGRRLSFWCMGLKLLSPRNHHGLPPCSGIRRKTSSSVMMLTLSTSENGKKLSRMHGTIRHSNATTSGLCIVGSSRWTI